MGEEFTVTPRDMHVIFGFSCAEGAIFQVPDDFNVNAAWFELTGFNNWNPSGMSPGLLQDNALLVVHRFLSHGIFGKKESTKVNAMEVYLLWAAKHGVSVSLTGFIWKQIESLHIQQRGHAAWAHIATGIAMHHNLDIPTMIEVPSIPITVSSFRRGHYVNDPYTWKPYEDREIVLRTRGRWKPTGASTSGAGQSSQPFLEDRMEEEAAYEQPLDQPPPHHFPSFDPTQFPSSSQFFPSSSHHIPSSSQNIPPPTWQYAYDSAWNMPHYFHMYQQNLYSNFQAFHTEFKELREDVKSLTTSMANLSTSVRSIDTRVGSLEEEWKKWKGEPSEDEEEEDEEFFDDDEDGGGDDGDDDNENFDFDDE